MQVQLRCKTEKRRRTTYATSSLNGIDYLDLSIAEPDKLKVFFIRNAGLSGLKPENFLIENKGQTKRLRITNKTASGKCVTLSIDDEDWNCACEGVAAYKLRLIASLNNLHAPNGFDQRLAEFEFTFQTDCPVDFDCAALTAVESKKRVEPIIDYLVKDYASFRRLMLDRLALIAPDWQERNPADVGIAIVEAIAYFADHLSYYQDAVATEAYLGTARRRISTRRHARLLDYTMHEGANARAWVAFQVQADTQLPRGSQLLSYVPGFEARIKPGTEACERALNQCPALFETMHDAKLFEKNNRISFYSWSDEDCCLPSGATTATLAGDLSGTLRPGDFLLLQGLVDAGSNQLDDENTGYFQVVRLIAVSAGIDTVNNQQITAVTWHAQDKLSADLPISSCVNGAFQEVGFARGNIVLADHGCTVAGEELEIQPKRPEQPRLKLKGITYCVPYDAELAQSLPACETIKQNPDQALPAVRLVDSDENRDQETWTAQRDLFNSARFDAHFVVERENDGNVQLRFGDNIYGRRPDQLSSLKPVYRIGSGRAGNVGAGVIRHVISNDQSITAVSNPLPAQGGVEPETMEQVRQLAPHAFVQQERAVTAEDYARAAQRHDEVSKAAATLRWTGSWHTVFITPDRKGGLPVDDEFKAELRQFLERFRLAGHDIEVIAPGIVPLEIVMTVCVASGYQRRAVLESLVQVFSNKTLSDGRLGFFHPDNFTFGQPVYLSRIVAAAMDVPGVRWVDLDDSNEKPNRFRRLGKPSFGEIEKGMIEINETEIARLDNDPNAPENGKIEFLMEGGL